MVYEKVNNKIDLLELCRDWEETLIWSCLQGYQGSAWVTDENHSQSAQLIVNDFCFFGKTRS